MSVRTLQLKLHIAALRRIYVFAQRFAARYVQLEEELAIAESLPVGTLVKLTCKGCGFADWQHECVWEIEYYNYDVNDYRLRTRAGPEASKMHGYNTTYASRKAMEIVR